MDWWILAPALAASAVAWSATKHVMLTRTLTRTLGPPRRGTWSSKGRGPSGPSDLVHGPEVTVRPGPGSRLFGSVVEIELRAALNAEGLPVCFRLNRGAAPRPDGEHDDLARGFLAEPSVRDALAALGGASDQAMIDVGPARLWVGVVVPLVALRRVVVATVALAAAIDEVRDSVRPVRPAGIIAVGAASGIPVSVHAGTSSTHEG